jgi:hypothetical protein
MVPVRELGCYFNCMANINDTTACMLMFKMQKRCFFVYFLAGQSMLATALLMFPIFVFLSDVWILTQRAGTLPT